MSANRRIKSVLGTLGLLASACGPAVGTGGSRAEWDVRGNYALTYDDALTLKLDLGGAVREVTAQGYGGVADFGTYQGQPLRLDLSEFCARPEVLCPSESLWSQVSIDQQDVDKRQTLYILSAIDNTTHTLPTGVRAEARGGLVDHSQQDTFVLGLGAASGGGQSCGALAVSLAGGRFHRAGEKLEVSTVYRDEKGAPCTPSDGGSGSDGGVGADGGTDGGTGLCAPHEESHLVIPAGAAVDGIVEGKVALGWLGACAFGPFIAGATLTLETGFTAQRIHDFDPPPYTPPHDADAPDAGSADAGSPDAGDGGAH